MESTIASSRSERTNRTASVPLLPWYFAATLATSASGFAYLFAMRQVMLHDPAANIDALTSLYWIAGVFAPVIVGLKGAILGGLLWATLALLDVPVSFRHCLRTAWSAESLLVLPQFVAAVVALARGATSHADLYVPLGLDLFWSPAGTPLAVLSHMVNAAVLLWSVVIWWRLRSDGTGQERPWAVPFATAIVTLVVVLLPILQLVD